MMPAEFFAPFEALKRTVEEHRRRKIRASGAPLLPDEVEINPYPIHATSRSKSGDGTADSRRQVAHL